MIQRAHVGTRYHTLGMNFTLHVHGKILGFLTSLFLQSHKKCTWLLLLHRCCVR